MCTLTAPGTRTRCGPSASSAAGAWGYVAPSSVFVFVLVFIVSLSFPFVCSERLPSIGFNTRDGLQVPFPEELPINRDTLTQYCADFLSGKLKNARDTEEMAKKAVQASRPINPKNRAARKERKEAPEQVRGVSEQYGDGTKGDRAVVTVTMANFQEVVMDDEKDVVLMLHAKGCEGCAHLAVYYKVGPSPPPCRLRWLPPRTWIVPPRAPCNRPPVPVKMPIAGLSARRYS